MAVTWGLAFDESRDLPCQDGRLVLEAAAQIDLQANQCKQARLDLETARFWNAPIPPV